MLRRDVFLGLIPAALLAANFWDIRQPADWTPKEIEKLRSRSPWAKFAGVSMKGGAGGGGMRGGGMGGPGMGPGGMGGGGGMADGEGGGGGGMRRPGGMGGSTRMPEVTVRWESAAPMQAASSMAESPFARAVAGWAQEHYVIMASGYPAMGGRGRQEGGADPSRAQQMQQRLLQGTVLKRKGKPPIQAVKMGRITGPEGPLMTFLFPREPIAIEDKEVSFESAAGPMEIKAKFNLKHMVYGGQLAL
ncbi:MAG: hypothetical protein IPM24_22700 [Bryobacterales bacterium]|nr:hypothetical protein [Bryobacterales bacterium]